MAHDHHHQSNSPYTQTLDELDFMRSIHNACIEGAAEKVRNIIVKKGSHVVNERDSTGYTPLDIDGQTPLHKACEKGYTDIAVMLVKRDRSLLEIKDNKGRTPTECCAREEMKTIVFKVGSEKS
ncbi:8909_t:CDS:2 [Paraglomus brasilianum]|uniref:8909_t:CDS:1 n=1 Tax=Paraglomus brasilianum TaxID=144538 RepID=A0A9N9AF19_9GLOM|nr:8909_t:CDS:2 [Paraglomus brasilianum]